MPYSTPAKSDLLTLGRRKWARVYGYLPLAMWRAMERDRKSRGENRSDYIRGAVRDRLVRLSDADSAG